MTANFQGIPNYNVPVVDGKGQLSFAWYNFFISLWERTGGGTAEGNVTNVSASGAGGIVANVTNPTTTPNIALSVDGSAMTSELSTFTSTTKGVVPASGGSTTNFIRADGQWIAPFGFYTAVPISNTGYVTVQDEGGTTIKLMVGA